MRRRRGVPFGNEFLNEFQDESDRASAVLGAAMLDEILKELILKSVREPEKMLEALLEQSKPLGTFAARIDAAYAFGLIGDDDAADMHVVRRIRNEFAHRLHGLSFGAQRIADLTKNLRCVRAYERAEPSGISSPRDRFVTGVAFLASWLLWPKRKRRRRPPKMHSASMHYGYWNTRRS